jgi:hypothetical protein
MVAGGIALMNCTPAPAPPNCGAASSDRVAMSDAVCINAKYLSMRQLICGNLTAGRAA